VDDGQILQRCDIHLSASRALILSARNPTCDAEKGDTMISRSVAPVGGHPNLQMVRSQNELINGFKSSVGIELIGVGNS
jgi:hypothetical protein